MTGAWRSIAAKLYLLVGLVILILAVLIAIAMHASGQMGLAGAGLYRGVQGVSLADRVETLWERARGLAARAPAELDLGKQQQFHTTFTESVAAIHAALAAQRRDDDAALAALLGDVGSSVTNAAQSAADVFRLSASFAQDQAVSVLNGPFQAAETQIAEHIGWLAAYQKDTAAGDLARLNEARRAMGWMIGIAGALAVALVACVGVLLARGISGRVHVLTDVMRRLAEGELMAGIPCATDRDEIGHMARAVEVFRRQAIENNRLTAEQVSERAAKDRRQVAMDRHTQDFGTSVSVVMTTLVDAAGAMRQAATTVSEAARRTRETTSVSVTGATRSSQDLGSVAAAAEQMSVSIGEISRQVTHVSAAVGEAVSLAARTDAKVEGLAEAADRIGDVVRVINDIACQTSLLALNATIEAARAGEAGKGFAVVAGEVKALAAQTAQATERISAQIVAIRSATGEAVTAVREVGSAIGQVEAVATAIAAAVEQQAAATREIAGNVQSVSTATGSALQSMQEVLAIAQRTDASAQSALMAAGDVGETAATLHSEVSEFLAAMTDHDDAERRSYERIAGHGVPVTVQLAGREVAARLLDISHGGAALDCRIEGAAGAVIQVQLPGNGGMVTGRIVRAENEVVAVAFRQDPVTLARIGEAIEAIRRQTPATAA